MEDAVLITERAHSPALPPCVLVQPTVLFSKMMDKSKKFLMLLRNESLNATSIPMGTAIARLNVVDVVTKIPTPKSEAPPKIDAFLFDFGVSPLPNKWRV